MGERKERQLVRVFSACALAAGFLFQASLYLWNSAAGWGDYGTAALTTGISLLLLFVAAAALHMRSLRPADGHTWNSLILDYVTLHVAVPLVAKILRVRLNNILADCKSAQDEFLRARIASDVTSVYVRDKKLQDVQCGQDLIQNHPLTTYADYTPYVERILHGEQNVLTTEPVTYFALTSGTTGKNKVYPIPERNMLGQLKYGALVREANPDFFRGSGLSRNFNLRMFYPNKVSPTGVPMGGIARVHQKYELPNVTPKSYQKLAKESSIFYSQAIFSLAEREIGHVDCFSSDIMLAFIRFFLNNQDPIIKCIETGRIEPFEDIQGEVLQDLNRHLKRDPDRARELRYILCGPDVGLMKRLWPRLHSAVIAKTGSFAHAATILAETYFKDVIFNFPVHGASEGWFGANFEEDPLAEDYTFLPFAAFLEFIPLEKIEEEQPETKLLHEVEVGKSYEIVASNVFGMYRLRIGDIITITGHSGDTPKYKFEHRTGQVLNLVFERTAESVLLRAVEKVQQQLGEDVTVLNYTSTESFNIDKITGEVHETPCYVIFVELDSDATILSESQTGLFESSLFETHEAYRDFREQGGVAPMEVIQVVTGTFDALRRVMTLPNSQYKVPRVLRKPEGLTCLWDNRKLRQPVSTSTQTLGD